MTPQLEVHSILKRFGGLAAVNDVSFSVLPGEIVGLIGPNGAGKTTLLDLLWGFYEPAQGWIRLCGKDLKGTEPWRRARLGIRRTFQGGRLPETLRGYEQLALSTKAVSPFIEVWRTVGRCTWRRSERAKTLENALDLGCLYSLQGGEMSYGQRKRMALACALMAEAKVVLLDEPISGVDPLSRKLLAEAITISASRGASFLVVEHDMDFIRGICTRVLGMVKGEIVAEGTFLDMAQHRGLLGGYLGRL